MPPAVPPNKTTAIAQTGAPGPHKGTTAKPASQPPITPPPICTPCLIASLGLFSASSISYVARDAVINIPTFPSILSRLVSVEL
ncbi:hypothetical protein [Moellerella wisconsensis]|uniref:hypothetical protein n=1 Tax=Moellerella wisconsensis TaxID=158849 RepID=UPI0010B2B336|nr:hypothetical protein [Moellerella wisconsensis]VFS48331.1 Uncharacterised protein [Moellerella wisconsensis]